MRDIEWFTSSTASKIDMELIATENHNQQNQEELKARIQRLEDRIHRAAMAFFRDGSDGHVASQMLQILEEERGKK